MELFNFKRKVKVIMMTFITLAFLILFMLFIILIVYSPGKPKPFIDENGKIITNSISEKGFIEINRGQIGYFIKGKIKIILYCYTCMVDCHFIFLHKNTQLALMKYLQLFGGTSVVQVYPTMQSLVKKKLTLKI